MRSLIRLSVNPSTLKYIIHSLRRILKVAMFLKILLLVTSLVFISSEYVDYTNHKVYRITPQNEREEKILKDIDNEQEYLFWTEHAIKIGREVRIQVAPAKQDKFEKYLSEANITATRVVEDVQRSVDFQYIKLLKQNLIWLSVVCRSKIIQ